MTKRIFVEYIYNDACYAACYEGEKAFTGETVDFILNYTDCLDNKNKEKFMRQSFNNKYLTQENHARLEIKKRQRESINCYWEDGAFVVDIYTRSIDDAYQTISYARHYIFDVENITEVK